MTVKLRFTLESWWARILYLLILGYTVDYDDIPPHQRRPVVLALLASGMAAGAVLIVFMSWVNSMVVP
jgi:hypothetical protein